MSIALIQTWWFGNYTNQEVVTRATPYSVASGSLLVIFWGCESRTATLVSITDTLGNTWKAATPITRGVGANDISTQIWYSYNNAGSGDITITLNYSGTIQAFGNIAEFTGVGASFDPLDRVGANAVASTSAPYNYTCGSVTPRTDGALVVATCITRPDRTEDGHAMIFGGLAGEDLGGPFEVHNRYAIQTTAAEETGAISFDATADFCASMATFLATPYEAWVDIPNWHAHEYLNASQYPGGAARCVCKLWTRDAGVMVKARLVSLLADGTVDAVAGTSAEITSQTPADATFSVTLAGNKTHKLQVTSDAPGVDLFCSPDAKVTA
jgi:hypothetical protein